MYVCMYVCVCMYVQFKVLSQFKQYKNGVMTIECQKDPYKGNVVLLHAMMAYGRSRGIDQH
jgi:hypothetical protein